MTNTKQPQQSESATEQIGPITPTLLKKRFSLIDQYVQQVRKSNEQAGIDKKRADQFTPLMVKLMSRDKLDRFLSSTINPKTGMWYSIKSLSEAGVISNIELENQFYDKTYPSFELIRLTRIHTNSGDFLHRFLYLFCLDKNANIMHISWPCLDYYNTPMVAFQSVPSDPQEKSSNLIRVGAVADSWVGHEPTGKLHHLLPFSVQNVEEILRQTPPIGAFTDRNHGTCLALTFEGETQPEISVTSLDEFLTDDFVSLFREKRTPSPTISVSSKALLKDIMTSGEQKQYA